VSAVRLSLARTTIASVAADGVLALSSVVVVPYLIGHLGTEQYGIFALITVLAGQLVGLHLGIGWAATRRIAETDARAEPGAREATVRAVLALGAAGSALVAVAFAAVASLAWRRMFHASAAVTDVALATVPAGVLIAATQPALQGLHGILYGQQRFFVLVGLRLGHGLARLAVAVVAVAMGGGVLATAWSQAVVDLIVVIATGLALLYASRGPGSLGRVLGEARAVASLGIPFAIAGVFASLLADVEKLAISIARSVEDFTYYSVPFNVTLRLTVFAVAFASVLAPRLSALIAEEARPAAADLVRRAVRVSQAGMVAVVAPLIALLPELLRLWLGAEFAARSTLPTRILLVAMLPRTLGFVTESVLRAVARPLVFTVLYAAELPLHLVAVFFLVRALGIRGAALAWTLRVCLDAAAQWTLARRGLHAPLGRAIDAVGPPLALALLAAACQLLDGPGSLLVRAALAAVTGGLLVLRLLSREDWSIFRNLLLGRTGAAPS